MTIDNTNGEARKDALGRDYKKPRGFAAMDRKLVSEIARKGGKSAHAMGRAHEFTPETAKAAGVKGGRATHKKLREKRELRDASKTSEALKAGSSSVPESQTIDEKPAVE